MASHGGGGDGDFVEIVEHALDMNRYIGRVRDPGAGAIATFSGTTRDTFENKQVVELRYEAYTSMALIQLNRICKIARERWSLIKIALAHRLGVVAIGEESVFVAVSSVHRKEALAACEFLIDELKASVPIWKKEVYSNGEAWKENVEFQMKNSVDAGDAPEVVAEKKT